MEAEIKELNQFLVSFELEGAGFAGYRRLFHEGDVKGFDFQWGGRISPCLQLPSLIGLSATRHLSPSSRLWKPLV